jgi:hypothetical protein
MSWIVQTDPNYDRDVNLVTDWYADRAPEMVNRFLIGLDQIREQLKENPLLHAARRGNLRMAEVPGFKYGVWYLVNPKTHSVYVAGVVHHHRNPSIVAKRTHTHKP